jgi:hypothetical protein
MGLNVHVASCPWGEMSMGELSWGELLLKLVAVQRVVRGIRWQNFSLV